MKHVAVLAIAVASSFAGESQAGDRVAYSEPTITQASELVPWCKAEAESRYIARNITPYQWSASYHDSVDVLYVDGRLRVHGDDVVVRCRIARGARQSYGVIEIDDPKL
ncbi:hypothetical protein [Xanthomonas sacchari]|uniref:hypothetical protein n=1 Tax=Xanthomonas sacchari TaxID=56458 RepID=UPI0012E05BBA|nr:hypothetical protein [Xanthomonas sacchari]